MAKISFHTHFNIDIFTLFMGMRSKNNFRLIKNSKLTGFMHTESPQTPEIRFID